MWGALGWLGVLVGAGAARVVLAEGAGRRTAEALAVGFAAAALLVGVSVLGNVGNKAFQAVIALDVAFVAVVAATAPGRATRRPKR